jgi:hypothetical protein
MTRMLPLRTGWDPSPGDTRSYPPDLPRGWRLSYFANEHWGVLVPAGRWRGLEADEARAWVADTPPRFRFYLDIDPLGPAGALPQLCLALKDRLGGLVGPLQVLAALPELGARRLLRVSPRLGEPKVPLEFGVAWEVPASLVPDLRGARGWLEARVRGEGVPGGAVACPTGAPAPVVALLGECGLEDLARWQLLTELMGFA